MSRTPRPLSSTPKGSRHEATIDGFTHGGEGVARIDGKAVFTAGALPGETVTLQITLDNERWARASLVEVHDASADRVEPPCPVATTCGGCDLQHVAPEAQIILKTRVVTEQLERIGKIVDPPVLPGRAVGPALGYRAHARLHAAPDGRLGFHAEGTNDVVAIDSCPVMSPAAQALHAAVGNATGAVEVELRADGVSEADAGAGAVVLTPGPGTLEVPEGDFDVLLTQPNGSTVAMRGDGERTVHVAGLEFGVPSGGFFQVSTAAAEALVEEVLAAVGDVTGSLTWDLYAGVGLLTLPLARAGAEVLAIEGHKGASAAIAANAERNGLEVTVETADVRAALRTRVADGEGDPPEVVVLDPPRTGVGESAITDLATLGPARVVLVACDPASLARDAKALVAAGYRLTRVQPLDLFPMTHHVEAIATFTR